MTLRVVNDSGIANRTRILDAETGEDLTERLRVSAIDLRLQAGGVVSATLTVAITRCEIDAGNVFYVATHPETGRPERLRALEWADGTRLELPNSEVK